MEQKHESDLTGKEKRELEWQKIKSLGFKERMEYLWTYYKYWVLGLVIVILIVDIGVSSYKVRHQEVLIGAAFVGSVAEEQKELEESVKAWIGSEDEDAGVEVYTGMSTDPEDVPTRTTLGTWMMSETLDVLVCTKELYESYNDQKYFADMREVLGESASEYEDMIQGNAIVIKNTKEIAEKLGVYYDEIYISFVVNGHHLENARAMVLGMMESFSF